MFKGRTLQVQVAYYRLSLSRAQLYWRRARHPAYAGARRGRRGIVVSHFRSIVATMLALLSASCASSSLQSSAMHSAGSGVELPTQAPSVADDEIAGEKRRQQVLTLQSYAAQSARIENVAHKLLVANRADCKNVVTPRPGWQVFS